MSQQASQGIKKSTFWITVGFLVLVVIIVASSNHRSPSRPTESKVEAKWCLLDGVQGGLYDVYVSPEKLKDKIFMSDVIAQVLHDTQATQINFFDKKIDETGGPMKYEEMLHWRAVYEYSNGKETFFYQDYPTKDPFKPKCTPAVIPGLN